MKKWMIGILAAGALVAVAAGCRHGKGQCAKQPEQAAPASPGAPAAP